MRPSEQAAHLLIQTWGKDAPAVVAEYLRAFPEGCRLLKDIEAYAGVNRPGPAGNEALQRMEGRREMFLWIRMVLSLTPAELEKLIGEADDAGSND